MMLFGTLTPLRNAVFAQIGDYHGFIKTSWHSGMPSSGRHKSLTHAIRTKSRTYIHDPDNGDEAYDLTNDPSKLRSLTKNGRPPLGQEFQIMRAELMAFRKVCNSLRRELFVVRGDRGLIKGWE